MDGDSRLCGQVQRTMVSFGSGRRLPWAALLAACCLMLLHSVVLRAADLEVRVDIKPGDEPTALNPQRGGMLPVAILSSTSFDATSIDVASVRFEGSDAAAVRSMTEDVDGDERLDLIFLFRADETGVACGAAIATLTGRTRDGLAFSGSEEITTVDCEPDAP